MRVEVNERIQQDLDEIKQKHYIYGKGHSDTVAFLVRYYKQHQTIKELIEEKLSSIPDIMQESFLKALRTAVTNILREQP